MVDTIFHHAQAVRRLYKPDMGRFEAHLTRLDPETRYNRFGLQVSDDYLRNYADLSFRPGVIVYGAFVDGELRGGAELRLFQAPDRRLGKNAEAAFSVERPWRRRGIGTDLMGHLVLAARNRHVAELTIFCLQSNAAMLKLARKFSADLEFEHNDVTGHLVARPPSALSLFREFMENSLDLGSSVLDLQNRMLRAGNAH